MSKNSTVPDIKTLANKIDKLRTSLNINLGLQLLITGELINRITSIEDKKIGLTRERYDLLFYIIGKGGTTNATDLSKVMLKPKQMLTKIIDGLEKDRLVARNSKNKDRRIKNITITIDGIKEVERVLPLIESNFGDIVPKFNKKQTQGFINALVKIKQHISRRLFSDPSP